MPLSELVELLHEVEDVRNEGGRALARVIHERRRRAGETIDGGQVLPRRRRPGAHRVPELRSFVYHRLVAQRLDRRLVEEARERLRRWLEEGRIHPDWAAAWERILEAPLPRIVRMLGADTAGARTLRQSSPFAGVLNEQERRRLLRTVGDRGGG